MHGGKGSGAPKGNRNALKHGRYTAETRGLETQLRAILGKSRAGLAALGL